MKKILILIICINFVFFCSCSNDINDIIVTPQDYGTKYSNVASYDILDISSDGDNIYFCDKSLIKYINKKGEVKTFHKSDDSFFTHTCYEDGRVYALDIKSKKIIAFNTDGLKEKEWLINEYSIYKMMVFDNKAILLYLNNQDDRLALQICDLNSNYVEDVMDDYNIISFSKGKKGEIIVGVESEIGTSLVTYDYENKKIINKTDAFLYIEEFEYDEKKDSILFFDNGVIYEMNLKEKECTDLLTIYTYPSKIISSDESIFFFDSTSKEIVEIDRAKLSHSADVTFLTNDFTLKNYDKVSFSITKLENKGFSFSYRYIETGEYYKKLNKMLEEKDKSFDLYLLSSDDLLLVNNKYFYDLSLYKDDLFGDSEIDERILRNSYYSNKLIGIPIYIISSCWVVNEDLMSKVDVEIPNGYWNFNDFMKLAEKVRKDIDGDSVKDTYIVSGYYKRFPIWYEQYCANFIDYEKKEVSFNNSTFIQLLIDWKKLWDNDLITEDHTADALFYSDILNLMKSDKRLVYQPLINEQTKYPLKLFYLCINPYSENKEKCIEFLKTFLSEEIQVSSPDGFVLKDLSLLNNSEKNFDSFSNEVNRDYYDNMLDKSKIIINNYDFNIYVGDLIEQYIDNKITTEETAMLIEEKAKDIMK